MSLVIESLRKHLNYFMQETLSTEVTFSRRTVDELRQDGYFVAQRVIAGELVTIGIKKVESSDKDSP